jgi:NitT/TauT family transport system permease protein
MSATTTTSAPVADAAQPVGGRARRRVAFRGWPTVISMLVFFGLWELITRLELVNQLSLPRFTRVLDAIWHLMFVTGSLWGDLAASLERAAIGFVLALIVGVALGLSVGWSDTLSRWLSGPLEFFRQLPPLAMFPVFLLFLGIGMKSQIAMVFWGSMWPILLTSAAGCQQVDPVLVKAARSYGVTKWQMFSKVVLPSAIPMIATGIRLGGTYALLVLVAAEMIGAEDGIGFLIMNSQYTLQIPDMYAGILVLACLGLLLNFVLVRVERSISKWRTHV